MVASCPHLQFLETLPVMVEANTVAVLPRREDVVVGTLLLRTGRLSSLKPLPLSLNGLSRKARNKKRVPRRNSWQTQMAGLTAKTSCVYFIPHPKQQYPANAKSHQLEKENLKTLEVTFEELHSVVTSPKSRFAVKLKPDSSAEEADESDYLIRMIASAIPSTTPSANSSQKLTPLSTTTEDLPDLIVYETSYANYPLILQSGGIKRAGGQAQLSFGSIQINEDGTEEKKPSDADVSIYLDLRAVMEAEPKISWARMDNGAVITTGNAEGALDKKYWKKAVGRRADIGVLFEDGVVKKEVPVGLRGKGAKGKKGLKGKGAGVQKKEMKATSEDDSASE
jgi:hypothetical protein